MNNDQCFILKAAAAFSGVSAYNGAMPADMLGLVDARDLAPLINDGLIVLRPFARERCMEIKGVALTELGMKMLENCPEEI